MTGLTTDAFEEIQIRKVSKQPKNYPNSDLYLEMQKEKNNNLQFNVVFYNKQINLMKGETGRDHFIIDKSKTFTQNLNSYVSEC